MSDFPPPFVSCHFPFHVKCFLLCRSHSHELPLRVRTHQDVKLEPRPGCRADCIGTVGLDPGGRRTIIHASLRFYWLICFAAASLVRCPPNPEDSCMFSIDRYGGVVNLFQRHACSRHLLHPFANGYVSGPRGRFLGYSGVCVLASSAWPFLTVHSNIIGAPANWSDECTQADGCSLAAEKPVPVRCRSHTVITR